MQVAKEDIFVMFPAMLAIVGAMLLMLFLGKYRLRRWHGAVLLAMYAVFMIVVIRLNLPADAAGAQ